MSDQYTDLREALAAYDDDPTGSYARDCFYGNVDSDIIRDLLAERDALREAAKAAIAYDAAIEQSANDPAAMSSFCTATGDNLDALYEDWITKARAAISGAPK